MSSPLRSLIASGTKVWLDSIDPDLVVKNREMGATGATSNPIIVADLIKTGRWDSEIQSLAAKSRDPSIIAWQITDKLVTDSEEIFRSVFHETKGNDGYVSFELDPLLEDVEANIPQAERTSAYIELGKKWSKDHPNRMIKVPATPGGIAALSELAAHGVPLNVTLIFSRRQYLEARNAVWQGAQKRKDREFFKSVYSIFVSRLDVYSEKHLPLLKEGQGWLGIVNAKRIWQNNKDFWLDKKLPLDQEIIFASTGTKKASDPVWKYVEAFAGSDIETNPPATNDAVEASGRIIKSQIADYPASGVLADIDKHLDVVHMEETLMREGLAKFADPQKALLTLTADKIS
jgi:transaldolase